MFDIVFCKTRVSAIVRAILPAYTTLTPHIVLPPTLPPRTNAPAVFSANNREYYVVNGIDKRHADARLMRNATALRTWLSEQASERCRRTATAAGTLPRAQKSGNPFWESPLKKAETPFGISSLNNIVIS